jgi:exo-beta-1,3-glucanase (GH17 family)
MPRYALVDPQDAVNRLSSVYVGFDVSKAGVDSGWRWLPCDPVAPPSYDPKTEKVTGPTYTVGAEAVTEVWAKVSLTAQEISDAKDAAVNGLGSGVYATLLEVILSLENDNRVIKAKINALIDATAAATAKFTAGQAGSITMNQLKAAIKALI